jgi:isopentenyl diphosphate isomerase/L-lactate dehydrogenase-like FMN-dependent dehydrogenase
VVLSNHGGRQLDFARSGIEVLVEVVAQLKEKRGLTFPNEKFQLFVDGGVRRATDVLKAIALGATAVGVGRPFLYSFSAYGTEGVEKALQILHVRRISSHLNLGKSSETRSGRVRDESAPVRCSHAKRYRPGNGRRV